MPRSELVQAAQAWIESRHDSLLADFQTVLRFPSIEEDALPAAPFGQANRDALDFMLGLARDSGMSTTDLDGYCGYADFGSGEKLVMTLGHLDVVPVGPGWKHDPFGAEIDGGWVYARGASDDKGPTMAMFYAARAVQAVWPDVPVRIRSVFGCNEESGFKCVQRYMESEEHPTLGVAPDAGWPCIHGEKGIANLKVTCPLPAGYLTVVSVSGGQRSNIVIDSCTAEVAVSGDYLAEMQGKVAAAWDRNLDCKWEGRTLKITSRGKAAHGAWPIGGDNAATRVFRFLKECAPTSQEEVFERLLEIGHIGGNGVGIAGADKESGPLTLNTGIVATADEKIVFTLNVRYPVTWKGADVERTCRDHLAEVGHGFALERFDDSKPLYFPLEHPLVKTICEVYKDETGIDKKPGTMGGGTYARAVPNCVAIGTGWEGDGPAHETDERMKVEHLFKMARIYAHLLVRLAEEAGR